MRNLTLSFFLIAVTISVSGQTYNISWTDLVNVAVNPDNSITKDPIGSGWTASAVSVNVLPPETDGYIQVTRTNSSNFMLGLSRLNPVVSYSASDYTIQVNNGSITVYEDGTSKGSFGTVAVGVVLKISREGSMIKYYKDNSVFYSHSIVTNEYLRADLSVHTSNGVVAPVTASFDKTLTVRPEFNYPTIANNDGSIMLSVDGAYAPVSYQWSSGEQTSSISNKPRGTYTVTVTDGQGRMVTKTFNLGFPIGWVHATNATIGSDNSVLKSDPSSTYDAGASSLNVLAENSDGWIEFVYTNPTANYFIGLAREDGDQNYTLIDFAYLIGHGGGVLIYEKGAKIAEYESVMIGDVFRIAKESGSINYYKNGVLLRTAPYAVGTTLLVDVSIAYDYGPTPVVTACFPTEIRLIPSITQPDNSNANGSIAMNVQGAYAPYSIAWSSGENSPVLLNKPRGTYTITVNDALGREVSRTYELGYKPLWSNIQLATVNSDNSMTKTIVSSSWNAGASSGNYLAASTNGWVEFTTTMPGQYKIGLSDWHDVISLNSMKYGFLIFKTGDVNIYENSSNRGKFANFQEGDVYRVERSGGFVNYYRNGTLLRSVAASASLTLFADVAIHSTGAPQVTFSAPKISKSFYAITDGNWNNPSTWSITEGGASGVDYPGETDVVFVKGYKINVNVGVSCNQLSITDIDNTQVLIEGGSAELKVLEQVTIKGQNNTEANKVLIVDNNGKINVINP